MFILVLPKMLANRFRILYNLRDIQQIDINRIKSVYGYKTINNINLNDYIKYNIKNNNFTKIYEQKKERGTGFSTAAGSFLEKNIPQSDNNVNSNTSSTTKYSIPTNKNNTQIKGLDYFVLGSCII